MFVLWKIQCHSFPVPQTLWEMFMCKDTRHNKFYQLKILEKNMINVALYFFFFFGGASVSVPSVVV